MRPIDADALKQYMGIEDAVKYGNETEEQQHNSYATLMNYEIADCIDDMPTLDYAPKQQWISVKDRLPEDDENLRFYDDGQLCFTSVLVHDEKRGTAIANRLMIKHHSMPVFDELATDGWVWSRPYEPTHWMPLPKPPKEGDVE